MLLGTPDRVEIKPSPPPEALKAGVIEDARRRQQRRRARLSVTTMAALAAAMGGYVVTSGGSGARFSDPRSAVIAAVSTARTLSGTPIQATSALGSVWVLTCKRPCPAPPHSFGWLFRINRRTGQIVQRIDVTNPVAFAISDGAVWVAHFYSGQVSRIDPRTGRTTQTISLPLLKQLGPDGRRFLPDSISAGPGAVWVGSARGWLAELDARSGRLISMVHAPFDATGQIVIGAHATWVAESSLGVGVIRPGDSRQKLLAIKSGPGQIAVDQLAIGGGLVWAFGETVTGVSRGGAGVTTNAARVGVLDERTGKIVHQLRLPAGPYAIAYGDRALFAADYQTGHLFRIDPDYRIHLLHQPAAPANLITVAPGAIWTTTKSGVLRRIAIPKR